MLELDNIEAGYGDVIAVSNVSLSVNEGEVVSLVGANGAGKTTTLRAISGLLPIRQGKIRYRGQEIHNLSSSEIVELGIAHVPEGRQLFAEMTVEENLLLGAYVQRARAKRKDALSLGFELFPKLADRRWQKAGTLSGGEQQMLAIARGIMLSPELLILDEPSLGLAPLVVESIFQTVDRVRSQGMTVLMVEQNLIQSLQHSQRGYILETGNIVLEGSSEFLLSDPRTRAAYLGLGEWSPGPRA